MEWIAFTLTMPDARYMKRFFARDNKRYVRTRKLPVDIADRLCNANGYRYKTTEDTMIIISIRKVTEERAKHLDSITSGFYGYDWMIDSIIKYDRIKVCTTS